MGLKDSLAKASLVPKQEATPVKEVKTVKTVKTEVVEAFADAIISRKKDAPKPKMVNFPSKGYRKTEQAFVCESCGKEDICIEVGKLLLCDSCAEKEIEAIKNASPEQKDKIPIHPAIEASIAKLNPEHFEKTLAQDDTPLYAKGRENLYFEFFNRSYDIDKMSDEELRDSIIKDGNTLFEVKVRQQKKLISLKERLAKKTEKEREKFRLDDLTYKPNLEEESPLPKPKVSQKEKVVNDLKKLGLDAGDLQSLLARFAKKEEKK